MARLLTLRGDIGGPAYALLATALLLSQHLAVVLAFAATRAPLAYDVEFWLTPLRRMMALPDLTSWIAALVFAFSLGVTWALALLSFRRASRSRAGYFLAALTVVPAIQIIAVAILALMPVRSADPAAPPDAGADVAHIVQGVLAGMAIIVFAVLVSAVTFGAYGWGLFVLTPLLVGVTTAYIANRRAVLSGFKTLGLVMAAAGLGTLALVVLALEGIMCIVMAAPLGAVAAALGGWIGREAALAIHRPGQPLMSIAVLPMVFAFEAAMPPAAPIAMHQTIDIAASPDAVWRALTSGDPIAASPGLVGQAGLAYPVRGRLIGQGVGATRIGEFSTGIARERITEWVPGMRLGFTIVSQPPAMEEMSPYRRVHAPHVSGYFETERTSFDLQALPGGRTRLTARATHTLRMDPVLYWEPVARWAIRANVARVLNDIAAKAEARSIR